MRLRDGGRAGIARELVAYHLEADRGDYLGYVRVVGRRRAGISLREPIVAVPTEYVKRPLLRSGR